VPFPCLPLVVVEEVVEVVALGTPAVQRCHVVAQGVVLLLSVQFQAEIAAGVENAAGVEKIGLFVPDEFAKALHLMEALVHLWEQQWRVQ